MAQFGYLFTTVNGINDGVSPYTGIQVRSIFNRIWSAANQDQGPISGVRDELAVSNNGINEIRVRSGEANVNGIYYVNDALVDINVPSVSNTTGHRVIVRSDLSANAMTGSTCRLAVIASVTGVLAPPAMTRSSTIYEIPLARFEMSSAGVITNLVDERAFCGPVGPLEDGAVLTAMIQDEAVTADKIVNAYRSDIENPADATAPEAAAGTVTAVRLWSPLRVREAIVAAQVALLHVTAGTNDNVRTADTSSPHTIRKMTQTAYDALSPKDDDTLYVISG